MSTIFLHTNTTMNTLKKFITDVANYCINITKTVFTGVESILKQVSTDPVKALLLILAGAIVADIVAKGSFGTTAYVIAQFSVLIKSLASVPWYVLVALVFVILGLKK